MSGLIPRVQGTAEVVADSCAAVLALNNICSVYKTLCLRLFSWTWSMLHVRNTTRPLTTNARAITHLDGMSRSLGTNILGVVATLSMMTTGLG